MKESEKAEFGRDQTKGTWFVHVASALLLSYDNPTTTSLHNPLYIYCTDGTEIYTDTSVSHLA